MPLQCDMYHCCCVFRVSFAEAPSDRTLNLTHTTRVKISGVGQEVVFGTDFGVSGTDSRNPKVSLHLFGWPLNSFHLRRRSLHSAMRAVSSPDQSGLEGPVNEYIH